MDTWFHSVWQIVQANCHKSQVRKETEISIVHCAPLLNLLNNLFHFQIAEQYCTSRSVMSFSRWAMSKISARCSWTCLRISWTKNQRSPCLLESKSIQHAIVELSSWFTLFGMLFRDVGAVKPLELMGFCPQQSNQLWGKSYRDGSWWGRSCPTKSASQLLFCWIICKWG